jgi:hypothetical protein
MSGMNDMMPPWGAAPFAAYAMPAIKFPPLISYMVMVFFFQQHDKL